MSDDGKSWVAESTDVELSLVADAASNAPIIGLGSSECWVAGCNRPIVRVPSVVGFPRDELSKSMLKGDHLVGADALKHRGTCDLYRPLMGHGVAKADHDGAVNAGGPGKVLAAETILVEHLLALAAERTKSDQAVLVAPAGIDAPLADRALRLMYSGYSEILAVPAGFASAYDVVKRVGGCVTVDFGATATVISIFREADPQPTSVRVIEGGGDLIDKTLLALLCRKCPQARIKSSFARHLKESDGRISRAAGPIEAILPIAGKPTPVDVSVEMSAAIRSFLKPVFDAIGELADAEILSGDADVFCELVLSGGGSKIGELPAVLAEFVRRRISGEDGSVSVVCSNVQDGAVALLQDLRHAHWRELKGLVAAGSSA